MSPRLISSVVYLLGAALLTCIVGIVLLAVVDKPQPDILSQVVIGALTGLAGILAAQRGTTEAPVTIPVTLPEPVEVSVRQQPAEETAGYGEYREDEVTPGA